MTEKERYEPIAIWTQVFRDEGFDVKSGIIKKRLMEAGVISRTIRDRFRQVIKLRSYAESDVRSLCKDLLQVIPPADENGLIEKDGHVYATIENLSSLLGISKEMIQSRINKTPLINKIRVRTDDGEFIDFFSLSEVRKICEDLVQNLPQADENGFIEKDGEIYATVRGLSRVIGFSHPTIKLIIQKSSLKPIQGRHKDYRILDFYPLSGVKKLCEEFQGLPKTNKKSLIEKNDETHGSAVSLPAPISILPPIPPCPLPKVKKPCQEMPNLPTADENGLIEKDGDTYASIMGLSILLSIPRSTIVGIIEECPPKSIQAKTTYGRIHKLYLVSEVEKRCEKLRGLPKVDENGLIQKGGEIYASIDDLSMLFNIDRSKIISIIRKCRPKSIRRKRTYIFYLVSEVKALNETRSKS